MALRLCPRPLKCAILRRAARVATIDFSIPAGSKSLPLKLRIIHLNTPSDIRPTV